MNNKIKNEKRGIEKKCHILSLCSYVYNTIKLEIKTWFDTRSTILTKMPIHLG